MKPLGGKEALNTYNIPVVRLTSEEKGGQKGEGEKERKGRRERGEITDSM